MLGLGVCWGEGLSPRVERGAGLVRRRRVPSPGSSSEGSVSSVNSVSAAAAEPTPQLQTSGCVAAVVVVLQRTELGVLGATAHPPVALATWFLRVSWWLCCNTIGSNQQPLCIHEIEKSVAESCDGRHVGISSTGSARGTSCGRTIAALRAGLPCRTSRTASLRPASSRRPRAVGR